MKNLKYRLNDMFRHCPETGELYRRDGNKLQDLFSGKYKVCYFEGRTHRAHRVIWAMHHGEWPEGPIDHENGIRADNRIENLRCGGWSGNARNRRATKSCEVRSKGVRLRKDRNRYRAEIYVDNKPIYLGLFKTEHEAAHAYNKAAILHHGEYACLNPF